jgi:7-cyano-7-deazaguanine synthase
MTDVAADAAVVLFSGGQDSTTCLAWACARFRRVAAVTIDYGQRHRIELEAATRIARAAGVEHATLPCNSFSALGGNSLTGGEAVEETTIVGRLPNTFVPGRNLIFLTLAAAWGWQRGIPHLVTGVCQTDYSGYPDCRQDTMDALQAALRAGLDQPLLTIHTPLMHLTKADTVRLLRDLGRLDWLALSHTCYNGAVPPCGHCPACHLRAKGFAEAGVADPLTA